MYRVVIQIYDNKTDGKKFDVEMKTEKLYELIGRYTVKYGAPSEIISDADGIMELDFCKTINGGYVGAIVGFARVRSGSAEPPKKVAPIREAQAYTPPPPKPEEPLDERLQALLNAEVLNRWVS